MSFPFLCHWEITLRFVYTRYFILPAADELWLIKEKYLSLLTDFPYLTDKEIMLERNNLLNSTHCIYLKSPKTDLKAYKEAQEALKFNEEQYFSKNELNNMLPDHLRKSE